MNMTRLRFLAEVNPASRSFDLTPDAAAVTFMPLETVWADARLDTSRTRTKGDVRNGYARFQDGDILVPKVTPTFQAGRSAIVADLENGVGAGSTELHVLRARSGVDPRYVRYVTQSKRFLEEGVAAFQGVAGLQRVPEQFILDFEVPKLTFDEQRQIADFLDAEVGRVDRRVAARHEQVRLELERKHALITLAVRAETADLPVVSASR